MRTVDPYRDRYLFCDRCAAPRRFERPPCRDGHGTDCPEWACVACGNAMLISPVTIWLERRRPVLLRRAA